MAFEFDTARMRALLQRGQRKGFLLADELEGELQQALLGSPEGRRHLLQALAERDVLVLERPEAYSNVSLWMSPNESLKADGEASPSAVDPSGQDPLRIYLRDMGATPLLDRHGESQG